jgi:ABC-type nitrate/sulfonate/bicarbonate transport system substrate-binding protein
MRSRLSAIGAAVILFLALIGFWKSAHKDAGEVRIAYLQIIPSLPVFIAQEQRLFDKENLRLKAIALGSSNDLVNAMVAGQADILPAVSLVPIMHLEIQSLRHSSSGGLARARSSSVRKQRSSLIIR